MDLFLRELALKKFTSMRNCTSYRLFYNYDQRIQEMPDYRYGTTEVLLQARGLPNDMLCFELSEKHPYQPVEKHRRFLHGIRKRGFKIALDDFGVGFSNLEVFYHCEPDFLKFDRFLISNIDADIKKRSFCSHLINLAKMLGVITVAEGVETEKELYICREIGFDLVQGFLIQRPALDPKDIRERYDEIRELARRDRRGKSRDAELIRREMITPAPICVDDDIKVLFERFHRNSEHSFFPIVDRNGFPLGIVHERTIKKYIYSPYGYDLLCNKSVTSSLSMFISKSPVVDINASQERILEIYVKNRESDGILITEDMKYAGYLGSRSLLNLLHEKNMDYAREINPLTKLPGNLLIGRRIAESCMDGDRSHAFVYFDIDNFKPFNDRFGFRQGDKVIIMLAETLGKV